MSQPHRATSVVKIKDDDFSFLVQHALGLIAGVENRRVRLPVGLPDSRQYCWIVPTNNSSARRLRGRQEYADVLATTAPPEQKSVMGCCSACYISKSAYK